MVKYKKRFSLFKMSSYELKFSFKNCPFLMIAEISACILHGLSFVVVIYMMQLFFDTIADAVNRRQSFKDVFTWALFLGITVIFHQLINGIENWLYDVLCDKLRGYAYLNLYRKSSKIKAENFESPEFLDELSKAKEGAEHFELPLFPIIGLSTFYLSYFLGVGGYIYSVYPLLAISIVMVFIPSFLGQYIKSFLYSKLADEVTPYRRKYEYYEECICGKEYYKETRLLSAVGFFTRLYKESLELLTVKAWATSKKDAMIVAFVRTISLLGYLGILIMFVNALFKGDISVGVFVAVYTSIGKMFSMMDEVVDTLSSLMQNVGLTQNYMSFLETQEEEKKDINVSVSNEIELKNVTFRYLSAEKDTLEDINLIINAGETVAIVGENGSGKSTLVKLISGLFAPTSGQVIYDGISIDKVKRKNVYSNLSIVCQNFMKYKISLRNNVVISKDFYEYEEENKANDSKIQKLLEKVSINLQQKEFDNGIDTILAREFDGVDLSGGQWQRISIARGIHRPHSLIILDEPTAAIDPVEETNLFNMFAKLSKDKTSIIVTHRMGCAKIADKIIVMGKGKIVEMGSHEELLKKSGMYCAMYKSQSQWYQ